MLKLPNKLCLLALSVLFAFGAPELSLCAGQDLAKPVGQDPTKPVQGALKTEKIQERNSCFDLLIEYPVLGQQKMDQQIKAVADKAYKENVAEMKEICANDGKRRAKPYSYKMNYEAQNIPGAISILFKSYAFTGGAHGIDDLQVLNMSLKNGNELRYNDLFADTEGLFAFLSDFVRKSLSPKLGKIWAASPMFTEGLAPLEDSFKNFMLSKEGLMLHFPTYQIAPYSEGAQVCEVPLEQLAKFKPRPGIWQ